MKKPAPRKSRRTGSGRTTAAQSANRPTRATKAAPGIVGIGASAGGLEALELFLRNLPEQTGLAYVIVQHLDPARKSLMAELLQRATALPVEEVRDATKVRPDRVYVIPHAKDLSILHGTLHLLPQTAAPAAHLTIDAFFRSLAQDRQENCAGIILSGMGTDGTLGLRSIKDNGGLVLVQQPESAQFAGMPRSAIAAGLADIVARPEDLPRKLVACWGHIPSLDRAAAEDAAAPASLDKVILLLRAKTGHDFSQYRSSTLSRRVARRMGVHQLNKLPAYVRYLQENPQEVEILFKELLIGVTNFFRDPAAWDQLRDVALRPLLERGGARTLRAWVAGCSTGEEAYTLGMIFKEAVESVKPEGNCTLQIYATDLDQDAINRARQGVYPENIAADVTPRRLGRFFTREDNGYRINKEIREMVIFAPQNVIMDPPFTKLDVLCCRNLLIYLTPALQKKVLPVFHYSLNPGGTLFLGSAESIGDFTHLFAPVCPKERIFRRLEPRGKATPVEFPAQHVSSLRMPKVPPASAPAAADGLQAATEQILLAQHTPPAVLVNTEGDILFVSGRTGRFLEPAAGKANWNIVAMAREELRYELTSGLHRALREKETVKLRGLPLRSDNGRRSVDIVVQPFVASGPLQGTALIVFSDHALPAAEKPRPGRMSAADSRAAELARTLQLVRLELQASREEMQSSQEELRSMNEELQSANEELQSTNEELTTSKEEMQSLNEELQTVNAELQSKLEELSAANNDMKNLLNSTDIATVFLDDGLRVRRFTSRASQLFKFIPSDVGRPITDLATELHYPNLADDAREVLRTLVYAEKAIGASDGRWFNTRILPYRTIENRIDGVVITFSDITAAKQLEAQLREKCLLLESGSTSESPSPRATPPPKSTKT